MTALWLPPGVQARIDATALRKKIFTGRGNLPWSEKYRTYYGRALDLDRIENALRAAQVGIMVDMSDLSREALAMDPHLNSVAPKRFGKLRSADYSITPAVDPELDKRTATEIADMVRAKVAAIRGFRQSIYDLAWGVFDARAALEIDWRITGGRFPCSIASLDWIHPRRLGYGPDRELRVIETFLRVGWFEPVGTALDDIPGKFCTWMPRMFADYQELEGLSPRTIYWTHMKRFSARMRGILTELFALPWRTLEADKDAPVQKEDMDQAADDAEALGMESTAGFPPGIKLNLHWPDIGREGSNLLTMTSDDVDSQMSRMWLGQDATTKAATDALGGGMTKQLKAEQDLVLEMDGSGISERIQEDVIEKLVLLNCGADWLPYAPKFELLVKPSKDRAAQQDRYNKAISIGVPVPVAEYYSETGIRPPEPGESVLVVDAASGGTVAKIWTPPGGTPPPGALPPTMTPAAGAAPPAGAASDPALDDDEEPAPDGAASTQGGIADALRSVLGLERAGVQLGRQPNVRHGSPEDVIARGLSEGARHCTGWASTLSASVDGLTTATGIFRALASAAGGLPLHAMSSSLERTMVRSLMLGALDAAWEAENDRLIEIPAFDRARGAVLLAPATPPGQGTDFTAKPFQEAIAFFTSKSPIPKKDFDLLRAAAKQRAFTVATLARQEMLDTAHAELTKAIEDGADLRSFSKALAARFESAGWTRLKPSHVETVFRNATMSSYSSGRIKQMRQPAVLAARPYWQIVGVDDDRTRPAHAALHGRCLAADDAFWKAGFPPWGHNCRCRVVSRSARDLDRLKISVEPGATITGVPDEGWDSSGLLD